MKIQSSLAFSDEDIAAVDHFRKNILHPMCNLLGQHCELCPFNDMGCSDLEELMDTICTKKEWIIPIRE